MSAKEEAWTEFGIEMEKNSKEFQKVFYKGLQSVRSDRREVEKESCVRFIDIEKAFDRVPRKKSSLRRIEISDGLVSEI